MFVLILEVMDKLPSVADNWLFFLALGASGGCLCYRWFRAGLIVLPIVAFLLWFHWYDILNTFGEDILREVGPSYFTHSYAAMISACVLICAEVIANRRKLRLP